MSFEQRKRKARRIAAYAGARRDTCALFATAVVGRCEGFERQLEVTGAMQDSTSVGGADYRLGQLSCRVSGPALALSEPIPCLSS